MAKRKSILDGLTLEDIRLCIQVVREYAKVAREAERTLRMLGGSRIPLSGRPDDLWYNLMQMIIEHHKKPPEARIEEAGIEVVEKPEGDIKQVLEKIKSGKAKPISGT
ncbi:MAG: hypothetical protein B6U97_03460 [Candidatus Altiarchaeales archaeon ex4484_96]|nr:MAG: hypothetical protein B6U97_03460 [Candidatus Altiarchaeales archaeon ex4484_96]